VRARMHVRVHLTHIATALSRGHRRRQTAGKGVPGVLQTKRWGIRYVDPASTDAIGARAVRPHAVWPSTPSGECLHAVAAFQVGVEETKLKLVRTPLVLASFIISR
jgi:hypothetical protein